MTPGRFCNTPLGGVFAALSAGSPGSGRPAAEKSIIARQSDVDKRGRRSGGVLHLHRDDFRVTRGDLARHLQLGLPMGFQASIIAIGVLAVQVRLNSLGADAVAAYATAARVDGLAVALLASLGLAVSTFVAQNHGTGRPDRIRLGLVQAAGMSIAGAMLLGVVLITAGSAIIAMFVGPGEERVVSLASYFLQVNGACSVVLGVLFVLRGALQGLGDTNVGPAGRCGL